MRTAPALLLALALSAAACSGSLGDGAPPPGTEPLDAAAEALDVALEALDVAPEAERAGTPAPTAVPPVGMVRIDGGPYRPLFETAGGEPTVTVAPFYLDAHPVTVGQFLAFVHAEPTWRRSRTSALFAEPGYLRAWAGDLDPGPLALDAPVVDVSWFAARAYARWQGRRLPTTDEWEFAASASATHRDGRDDPDHTRRILAWVSRPRQVPFPAVGQDAPNVWGVHDLHGLVWEWTADVASALGTSDSRNNRDADSGLFCSAAAVGASDFQDYAAFLRYGLRTGLEARYAVPNVGFRTALDVPAASDSALPDSASP